MKKSRIFLAIISLTLLVLLFAGCKGVVPPSPGATEDTAIIIGRIKMPLNCCAVVEGTYEDDDNNTGCNEVEFWPFVPNAIVELKSAEKGQCNNEQILDSTFTDENGAYIFKDVEPGLYIITAYCPVTGKVRDFQVKDVAQKVEGQVLDAGIPDCTSTALALVIEKINDCYEECFSCFNKCTPLYKLVETIAKDVGKVDIKAIMAHKKFGEYCDDKKDDLVDLVCAFRCCVTPGATPGPTPGPDPTPNCYGNESPVLTMPDNAEIDPNDFYEWTVTATDDGKIQPLVFSLISVTPAPNAEFNLDAVSGKISWNPTCDDLINGEDTIFTITVEVFDGCVPVRGSFQITLLAEKCAPCYDNEPPTISINNKTINAGDSLSYAPGDTGYTAGDDGTNGDPVFSLSGGPDGIEIDENTGEISWDTVCGDGGIYNITVTITDACGETDSDTFTLTVIECPPAPCSIKVVKERNDNTDGKYSTPYPGLPWSFSFTGKQNFNLPNNNIWEKSFENLTPGVYTIKEIQKWGYVCTIEVDDSSDNTINSSDASVKINLKAGEDVTVTFTNSKCYNESGNQHILITDPSAGLQSMVDEHPYGVLATIRLTSGKSTNNFPEPYFYTTVKTHSGSYNELSKHGWCITKNKNINTGRDYDVILFPADSFNPSIGSKVEKVWGILNKAKDGYYSGRKHYNYTMGEVQDAIWKATDNTSISGNASNLHKGASSISGSGVIAIPVNICGTRAGSMNILSVEEGTPVDKNK